MEAVLDNVRTAISIAQQNSVQLTRANLRLDVLEDRLARALLYMDTSSSSSSSSNDSSLDDSIRQHDAVSNDIGFMIPCTAEVQLEALDEMLKDTANRQWMVRYHAYNLCQVLRNMRVTTEIRMYTFYIAAYHARFSI